MKDPDQWESLPLLGRDEGVMLLEYRNCNLCDSTLVIELPAEPVKS